MVIEFKSFSTANIILLVSMIGIKIKLFIIQV